MNIWAKKNCITVWREIWGEDNFFYNIYAATVTKKKVGEGLV